MSRLLYFRKMSVCTSKFSSLKGIGVEGKRDKVVKIVLLDKYVFNEFFFSLDKY